MPFLGFSELFFPSKQAQEHLKQSRNDRVTANFDEFNKISYISVIFGPKIMLLCSCECHGYWCSCWQQHSIGASSSWFVTSCVVQIYCVKIVCSCNHSFVFQHQSTMLFVSLYSSGRTYRIKCDSSTHLR